MFDASLIFLVFSSWEPVFLFFTLCICLGVSTTTLRNTISNGRDHEPHEHSYSKLPCQPYQNTNVKHKQHQQIDICCIALGYTSTIWSIGRLHSASFSGLMKCCLQTFDFFMIFLLELLTQSTIWCYVVMPWHMCTILCCTPFTHTWVVLYMPWSSSGNVVQWTFHRSVPYCFHPQFAESEHRGCNYDLSPEMTGFVSTSHCLLH